MIATLTTHLWQSTFFAFAAGLLTFVFRKNRAQVRYWLWLSASLKFFVPFAVLVGLGSHLENPATRQIATQITTAPAIAYTMEQFSGSLLPERLPPSVPSANAIRWIPLAIVGLWLCGFLVIALIRLQSWQRIRAAVLTSTPTNILATVDIRLSPALCEPGVVGLIRPILLLPEGIAKRLTPSELNAVIAHEVCHIRRRDNLFAAMHMMVEAIFWFYPLVWWIGARLVEERERDCDEEVLRLGNQPDVYADAILNVCKLYIESPLVCVSGVSGASIKRRIEAIMSNRAAISLNIVQKAALTVAAVASLAVPVLTGVLTAPATRAQSAPTARPKFEVASIRPCNQEDMVVRDGSGSGRGGGGSAAPADPELFRARCVSVAGLIQRAYVLFADGHAFPLDPLKNQPIQGGPDWIREQSEGYTIEAKPASPQTRAMMNGPMLQVLLEDRFKLKFHRESKEVPAYALVVAKGGPRLQPTPKGGCTPGDADGLPSPIVPGQALPCGYMGGSETGGLEAVGVPITSLLGTLSSQLRRPIIDQTGLTGLFNYHFDAEPGPPDSSPQLDDPAYPDTVDTLTSALAKLGLKIQPAKGNAEFIVIDHVERPSEN